jgi:hypothetical protein
MSMSRGAVIGGRSKNVGGSSILTTKRRSHPINSQADPPMNLAIAKTVAFDITATWSPPTPLLGSFIGYTIELQQVVNNFSLWGKTQSITGTSFTYTSNLSGQYRVRIKSRYSFGDSYWIESSIV